MTTNTRTPRTEYPGYLRYRIAPGQIKQVSVRCTRECPLLDCFWATTHMIRSPGAGASGCSSRNTDWWVCGYRDQRGCPPEEQRRPSQRPLRKRNGAWEDAE